jgi:hypothetical protein
VLLQSSRSDERGQAMADGQGNRQEFQLQQDEIVAQAIEALERARTRPPGSKRYQLLKEAGKLHMQVMVERLSADGTAPKPKGGRPAAKRRRNGT